MEIGAVTMPLAVLGGRPRFPEPLHVGRPNIGDRRRLQERFDSILNRRELTNGGPMVDELERELKRTTGARHAIATSSATVGLQIAARALGLSGEVIMPSFTFVATAHALDWIGITPVFCDVAPRSHHLDVNTLGTLVGPKTTGIVGVHVWGEPCDVPGLEAAARRHGLQLMFDAAPALGCLTENGQSVARLGHVSVVSLHATKLVNGFEGGAILTDDDDLAARARLMRSLGFADYDTVVSEGTNAKMSEISAAMALSSLESMEAFIEANRANYAAYREGLSGVPGVALREPPVGSSHHYVIAEIDAPEAGLSRDQLVQVLHGEGVLARRYFHPGCHRVEPYRTRRADTGEQLPNTDRLCARVLALPTGTAVSPDQACVVARIIETAIRMAPAVRAVLADR